MIVYKQKSCYDSVTRPTWIPFSCSVIKILGGKIFFYFHYFSISKSKESKYHNQIEPFYRAFWASKKLRTSGSIVRFLLIWTLGNGQEQDRIFSIWNALLRPYVPSAIPLWMALLFIGTMYAGSRNCRFVTSSPFYRYLSMTLHVLPYNFFSMMDCKFCFNTLDPATMSHQNYHLQNHINFQTKNWCYSWRPPRSWPIFAEPILETIKVLQNWWPNGLSFWNFQGPSKNIHPKLRS